MVTCCLGKKDTQVVELPIVDSLSPRPPYLPLAVPKDLASRLARLHGDPIVWWIGQFLKFILRPQEATSNMIQEASIKRGFKRPVVGWVITRWSYSINRINTVGYATTNVATTNECRNEQFLSIKSGCYNERMRQQTVFVNKIMMLQWTQILKRTWKNTIDRHSMPVCMTCRAFPLWLERQSLSFLSFVRFSY